MHRRLRQLEEENWKLKKIVVNLTLDKHILQDVISRRRNARAEASSDRVHPGYLPDQHASGM
jgi:hypothetical protein